MNPGLYVAGQFRPGHGPELVAREPATGRVHWRGASASAADVAGVIAAARAAAPGWAARPVNEREESLRAFAREVDARRDELADAITRDTGRPRWDAEGEVALLGRKVEISIAARRERAGEARWPEPEGERVLVHRPHGVLAVLGPFNLPAHLPNGHIVPALLAGNAVVWKPSERAPWTAEAVARCWDAAGLPPGVLNVVQGGREVGEGLALSGDVDGLLFTGSAAAGQFLHRALAGQPHKLLALEMGGNNPLVVWDVAQVDAAAAVVVASAFTGSGQRCTCARRLIVSDDGAGAALVDRVAALVDRLILGRPDDRPEPFMGPVIAEGAAAQLLAAQARWLGAGATAVRPLRRLQDVPGHAFARGLPFVTPGLIDVSALPPAARGDEELFGPLLQIVRVADFEAALAEANRTRFGLAAGLLSDDPARWQRFVDQVRAGVVNWNRPTTGASSALPFGGVGASGNQRPAAYYAADFCAFPVASLQAPRPVAPALRGLRPAP